MIQSSTATNSTSLYQILDLTSSNNQNTNKELSGKILEPSAKLLELYIHLGILAGMGCRHSLLLPLSIPTLLLRPLIGDVLRFSDITNVDVNYMNDCLRVIQDLGFETGVDSETKEQACADNEIPSQTSSPRLLQSESKRLSSSLKTELKRLLMNAGLSSSDSAKILRSHFKTRMKTIDEYQYTLSGHEKISIVSMKVIHILNLITQFQLRPKHGERESLSCISLGLGRSLPISLFPLFSESKSIL
jgi:hypothetical protein